MGGVCTPYLTGKRKPFVKSLAPETGMSVKRGVVWLLIDEAAMFHIHLHIIPAPPNMQKNSLCAQDYNLISVDKSRE